MNVDTSNPNKLPILGDFAFIYWPYFSPQVDIPPQVKEAIVAINGLGESKSNLSCEFFDCLNTSSATNEN